MSTVSLRPANAPLIEGIAQHLDEVHTRLKSEAARQHLHAGIESLRLAARHESQYQRDLDDDARGKAP